MHLTGTSKRDRPLTGYVIRFQSFEVNLRSRELLRDGQKVKLPEQSFQILTMLLERPREAVMRDEIRKKLWPNDTVVEFENSIHAAVRRLRLALGDPAETPRYIETLARRGYRWMLPAEAMEVSPLVPVAGTVTAREGLAAAPLIGKKIFHYRVLHILGGGGMGVVYAAEDLKLGRRVALKFLPEELANDRSAIQRFEREARAASALSHPNICTIHGVEEHEGQPFIVMEMLEGQTLRDLISAASVQRRSIGQEPMPIQKLLDIGIQTLEGLDAAHQKGIIHRDIKPANIFISTSGQVKILDFGLAKREGSDNLDLASPTEAENKRAGQPNPTRTGVAMGTAGYMSPEQVRGEKLDARTDLFSFGLVLYEMAVGQRAFTGETAAILHEAILHHAPTPVRELNPRMPVKLEEIINKATEKDRGARYQTAEKIRRDLELLRPKAQARYSTRSWAAAGSVIALLLVATGLFLTAKHPPSVPDAPPEITLRQLTANSAENHVISAVISPDGNRLAYSDIKGLHVKDIESEEIHDLAQPQVIKDTDVEWECVAWSPDGATLLANAYPSGIGPIWYSPRSSIWTLPLFGASARKLRDDAQAYSIPIDGSQISFGMHKGRFGDREIWLMGPAGEHPRKLYETGENSAIGGNAWSPDGKRILYPHIDDAGLSFVTRDIDTGSPKIVIPASQAQGIIQILWLTDGRLIYAKNVDQAIGNISNLWAMRLDPHTGEPIEKPKRLTNWTGFGIASISATKNSRRLAFIQWAFHATIYLADLGADEARIRNPTHFTLTESRDLLADWTQDSKGIIFLSNRSGRIGIYKQYLNSDTPELVVTESGAMTHSRVSPDGKWILYLLNTTAGNTRGTLQLMRVAINGGTAQRMFAVRPESLVLCARRPSNVCAIAEPSADARKVVVTAFDPLQGRGLELTRIDIVPGAGWDVELSPDGHRIAALTNPMGPIQILSLGGQTTQLVHPKGLSNMQFLHWAANGRGLYVSTGARSGRALWHVDLQGNPNLLWENRGGNWAPGVPSPDGRHMAIQSSDDTSNAWMIENF